MLSRFNFIITLLLVLLCLPSVCRADWINLSGADYDAIVTIRPVDGAWKIIDSQLLEETRIDPFAQSAPKG